MKRFKCKKSEYVTDNKSYNILTLGDNIPYWDEGLLFYPNYSRITRKKKKRQLLMYQIRMYKNWKHNRVKQYKHNNNLI